MQKIFAICWLTWKAALRFKLFLVIAALLILAVVGLPLVVKSDGTAQGFTQIILTYTLSAVTVLLGFSTLWLSCGTLARDIEECQIQVVVTKPIARWQIWLGKWLGIVSLNAALLILAGGCIYGLLQWRATKLPLAEQKILREQVLVARGSAKEASPDAAIDAETEQILQNRLKSSPVTTADLPEVRKEIRAQVQSDYQLVPPGYTRLWRIDLSFAKDSLRDKPLQLRIKFHSAKMGGLHVTYPLIWQVGDPQTEHVWQSEAISLSPDTFHEFRIPAGLLDKNGMLDVVVLNPNDTAMIFPLKDGMEVLYPQGGFTLNFARALGIILCWMALLAAVGLMAASFLSFPVAAFFSLALMAVAFSSGTLAETIDLHETTQGNAETGAMGNSAADLALILLFKGIVITTKLVENFSPIDALSTGRSIPWSELAAAFGQIVLLPGGICAIVGIILFNRRELAAAQNQ
jgi:hypothetical protein